MKQEILNWIKIIIDKIKSFSKQNPKTALFLFGILVGLFVALIF